MIFILKGSKFKVKLQVKGLLFFFFFKFKGLIKKYNYLCLKDRFKIHILPCLRFRGPLCLCLTQNKTDSDRCRYDDAIIHEHGGKEPWNTSLSSCSFTCLICSRYLNMSLACLSIVLLAPN